MQYSYFSVISGFPHIKVQPFQNFLAVLPPPTLYKQNSGYTHLWGEGRGWACVNWKTPQKCKSIPRILSIIVAFLQTLPPLQKKKEEGYLCTGYVFTHTQNAPVEPNTLHREALTNW